MRHLSIKEKTSERQALTGMHVESAVRRQFQHNETVMEFV